MKKTSFFLSDYPEVTLDAYLPETNSDAPRASVLICPGGAYQNISPREGEPIANYYRNADLAAFVLTYSTRERAANYAPLIQAASAIRYLRENASRFGIDPQKIFTLGFSAGGHLAASAGILWNAPTVQSALGLNEKELCSLCRPNGMILSYPVITGLSFRHARSFEWLCGKENPSEEERIPFSLELHVSEDTPPAFIWHTYSDAGVPVENSLLLMNALAKKKISFEAHIFPEGPHGMALATEETACENPEYISSHVAHWTELSVEWIKQF